MKKKLSKFSKKFFLLFFFFPDSEIDAKIKNLLASDDWKSKTGDRGATVLTRKLSLGLFGEEVLRHGSVKGKCGYRLDTYLLGKIKKAVWQVYGKNKTNFEFEVLWNRCLISLTHLCKSLRSVKHPWHTWVV